MNPLKRLKWQHSLSELRQIHENEADTNRQQTLAALMQLRDGVSVAVVASNLSVSVREVNIWARRYHTKGLLKTLNYISHSLCLVNLEQQQMLVAHSINEGFNSVPEGVRWIQDTMGVTYSEAGATQLFKRLGIRTAGRG